MPVLLETPLPLWLAVPFVVYVVALLLYARRQPD